MSSFQLPPVALGHSIWITRIAGNSSSSVSLAMSSAMGTFLKSEQLTESFNGISGDMMAELLLYFITKGIVSLPVAAETALLNMPWGSHICQSEQHVQEFYERAHQDCRMVNGRVLSPQDIQTLVQVWKQLWK
jgi:hypothetical protein